MNLKNRFLWRAFSFKPYKIKQSRQTVISHSLVGSASVVLAI